ncbi:hypothetical protein N9T15_00460 [Pelagibacteraceae bacterium]|nr:hypothetical protein [Pelagibacteraceae bacterium]
MWIQKYKKIRSKKIATGVIEKSPEDAKELHKISVISSVLKTTHKKKIHNFKLVFFLI